jgi:ferredoxin-NADP reductase
MPQKGTAFPDYKPGQYIALRREDCLLTRRVVDHDGRRHYIPDVDGNGVQRRGPISHSYSICSAPFETRRDGHLEFYLILEEQEWGYAGRLTHSMFRMHPKQDDQLGYVDRIVGDFTLEKRARNVRHVVLVGTGTGLAPFISMVKQLHRDAVAGKAEDVRYTLLHTNRTREELAYHDELLAIESAGRFDFAYVPSVSRPSAADASESRLGLGRANNILRHILGMPTREAEDLMAAADPGAEAVARAALEKTVPPKLPDHLDPQQLRERMPAGETVVLTCGNPGSMDDVHRVAEANGMRFEKEDWKLVPTHG